VKHLAKVLADAGLVVANIYGRRKHVYSVHKKMQRQGVAMDGIYDLLAIRIILDGTAIDCYKAMGVIHSAYKPMFHRFRDFISSPKENGYQTLHTTVLSPDGSRVECQIRTIKMDLEAEKGVASHWRYKESVHEQKLLKDAAWMEFIRELTSEAIDTEDFVAKTRDALLGDQVLVLSPMGEVVNLPVGSTPVDFAYYIHTDLGHAMRTARVNGVQVPLDYLLKNGDVVEIIKTTEFPPNPQPEWLVYAKSPKTLLKLRRFYRSRPKAERVEVGRNLLRQYIVKEGLYPLNLTANEKLMLLLKQLPVRSIDDIYEGVALATFRVDEIIQQLKAIHKTRVESKSHRTSGQEEELPTQSSAPIGLASSLGVCLPGQRALRRRVELSTCCTPVPGDKIYGLWDRDTRRVRVHRPGCARLKTPIPGATVMELAWQDDSGGLHYPARISIISLNRVGLLFEVMKFLSASNINLGGAEFSVSPSVLSPDRMAQFDLVVDVESLEELQACMAGIEQIGDVIEVRRALHKMEKPVVEKD
ncbi:MAG TPA: bifunctional (p)ppGpp synthetase/guanosine-3',5'-bis(diphosphate) 3'-pyrophosphohydrolase, partial [Firmicutes bacterium]|nr:bifunctional (p)ppGpp synthetase/guanosine-3',5'-bis(diphosphate) 3'-pyrophosphohydrolase [Bacillota bacterium]